MSIIQALRETDRIKRYLKEHPTENYSKEIPQELIFRQVSSLRLLKYVVHQTKELDKHPEIERIDLGCNVDVFDYFFNPKDINEETKVKELNFQFRLFAASRYGTDSPQNIRIQLQRTFFPPILKYFNNRYVYFLRRMDDAVATMDTMCLKPNKTVRFINNKYHTGKKTSVNEITGKERTERTNKLLFDYLINYDISNGKLNQELIAKHLNITSKTLRNHFKQDEYLKHLFNHIKHQIKNRKFNTT